MLNDEICKLRDKLNKSIEQGNDYNETYKLSVELDELIAKYYKELGYAIDEEGWFHVKVEHLTKGSHVKVLKKCDYCGEISEVSYKDYLKNHDEILGDSCHKCENNKYIKTMQERYGVNNSTEILNFESKRKRTMLQRYGVEYTTQSKELREKGNWEKSVVFWK